MRISQRLIALAVASILLIGCDIVNDAVPPIGVGGGLFGLNGDTGKELSATFGPAAKASLRAASAVFVLNDTFDDEEAGDFAELSELVATIGVAVQSGNVGMRFTNDGTGAYPATVTATLWTLNFTISDAAHAGASALRPPPSGAPIVKNIGLVTFNREATCANSMPECAYGVAPGDVAKLADLFPIEVTEETYLARVAEVVFQTPPDPNTVNTINLTVRMDVSNALSDFTGLEASLFVAEYDTQITPIIF